MKEEDRHWQSMDEIVVITLIKTSCLITFGLIETCFVITFTAAQNRPNYENDITIYINHFTSITFEYDPWGWIETF